MNRAWPAPLRGSGAFVLFAALAAIAVAAWVQTVRDAAAMSMPAMAPSLAAGAAFTVQWGVMMTAMMLPSAAPMILLYNTVGARLSARGDRLVPTALFAAVYLLVWMLLGVPVYAAHVGVASAVARWPWLAALEHWVVAALLAAAGAYQLTAAKRACLRHCESPLGFLMRRWRSGNAATLRLALQHAGYCVGCCWGLMAILVAAGAMSMRWVVAITLVVFAEKVLPRGWRTSRLIGASLVLLAVAVALRPELVRALRGQSDHAPMQSMPLMDMSPR